MELSLITDMINDTIQTNTQATTVRTVRSLKVLQVNLLFKKITPAVMKLAHNCVECLREKPLKLNNEW